EKKEAQALFYPNLSFNARYSVAEGGRTFEFPAGDLLNPVYQTLNMLTESSYFPQVNNQSFYFYRPTEQVTKLELLQPLFNPQIYFNVRIRTALSGAKMADLDAYKRFLIAEIQKAYYDYLKTEEILELYDQTRNLLEENIRVNEKLFENDKITIDVVYRSRSELSNHEQRVAEAGKYHRTTSAYFNYLMNRDLGTAILVDSVIQFDPSVRGLQELISRAVSGREELQALQNYQQVSVLKEKLDRSNKLPRVLGAVDYGIQGEDYDLTPDDDFFLGSLILQWDLFAGLQNNARIQQSRIDREMINYQWDETQQLIELEVIEKYFDLQASLERIKANRTELEALKKAFEIIQKKYSEGQANLLEFIDARTSMTQAEQNLILTRYDHLIKYAALERAACLYPMESDNDE
ncbi:MAG: TolC family protein, partial [Cyclobacteriaceae bacterium]|nr:TolC family protein [Cyclobacteriaceae bacterium]